MEWLCNARTARLAAALFAVVTIAGCPELNHWSGPAADPFFSVPDPTPESWVVEGQKRENDRRLPSAETDD
jgi:hypothetical protein